MKINPEVFKEAAELIEKYMDEGKGIGCCKAFQILLGLHPHATRLEECTEYEFFKEMFYKKTPTGYWFGRPTRKDGWGMYKVNQKKRVAALMKAYRKAKKLNSKKKRK